MSVTDTKQEIIAILREADALLEKPRAWTRLTLCRNERKKAVLVSDSQAQSFCLSGSVLRAALNRKSPESSVRITLNVLSKLCRTLYGKGVKKYGTTEDYDEFQRFPLTYTNDGLLKSPLEARKILQNAVRSLSKKSVSETKGGENRTDGVPHGDGGKKENPAPRAAAPSTPPEPDVSSGEAKENNADHSDMNIYPSTPPAQPSANSEEEDSTLMHMSSEPVELNPEKPSGKKIETNDKDIDMPDLDLDLLNMERDDDDDKT